MGLAIGVLVAALAVLGGTGSAAPPDWVFPSHRFRVEVSVEGGASSHADRLLEVSLSGSALMAGAGAPGTFDPASLRVVEAGLSSLVPFQWEPGPASGGVLAFVAPGTTPAGADRDFHVYFDTVAANLPAASPPRAVGLSTAGPIWEIATPSGDWHFDPEGGAFASVLDADGKDWISYSTQPGSAGRFRGVPNAVHRPGQPASSFFHPGYDNVDTVVVRSGPARVVIESESDDGRWKARWFVGPEGSRMTMVDTPGEPWWFLYEGTPGGTLNPAADRIRLNDGTVRALGDLPSSGAALELDLGAPEWVGFEAAGPGETARSLLLVHHQNDSAVDSYYTLNGEMTVWGFGRDETVGGPASRLVGSRTVSLQLVDGHGHGRLANRTADVLSSPATVGAVEAVGNPPPTTVPGTSGYWLLGAGGTVYDFGSVAHHGDLAGALPAGVVATDIEPAPDGAGYWLLDSAGSVTAHGSAADLGSPRAGSLEAGEWFVSISATPSGDGYWVFTSRGRVHTFGDATDHGGLGHLPLNGAIVDSIATPDGTGYYLVGTDGGVFALGTARFWGSMGSTPLNAPVNGMVAFGDGYLMVADDGGIFSFSTSGFFGSLGGQPIPAPIVGVAAHAG